MSIDSNRASTFHLSQRRRSTTPPPNFAMGMNGPSMLLTSVAVALVSSSSTPTPKKSKLKWHDRIFPRPSPSTPRPKKQSKTLDLSPVKSPSPRPNPPPHRDADRRSSFYPLTLRRTPPTAPPSVSALAPLPTRSTTPPQQPPPAPTIATHQFSLLPFSLHIPISLTITLPADFPLAGAFARLPPVLRTILFVWTYALLTLLLVAVILMLLQLGRVLGLVELLFRGVDDGVRGGVGWGMRLTSWMGRKVGFW
ncbi:hypothetical protein BC937DRAFT_88622 [Endogone sp. FLAS-F59071]|nr:hypothetical protein BC937DRAFT_88622 [Endogone sp. FLAS-F59071]|eukprot:RUS18563.1 hypothetical protein BC937DRAFT_88622 [Endogone sp. FLAS-F59071]